MTQLADIAPFRFSGEDGQFALQVEGDIPCGLRGKLIRTSPAGLTLGQWQAQHQNRGQQIIFRTPTLSEVLVHLGSNRALWPAVSGEPNTI